MEPRDENVPEADDADYAADTSSAGSDDGVELQAADEVATSTRTAVQNATEAAPLLEVTGSLGEFWAVAVLSLFSVGTSIPMAWYLARHRLSVRAGALFGGGLSVCVAAVALFLLIEVGTIKTPTRFFGVIPLLIALVTGPIAIFHGLNSWIVISRRTYSSQLDVVVVVVVLLVLIGSLVYTIVRSLFLGLLFAM